MRNLFRFIARHYFFFLFIALQVVALTMIFQNHLYHRSAFINSSGFIASHIFSVRNTVTGYFSLRSTNQQLAEQNTLLLENMSPAYLKTDQQIFTFNDTLYRQQYSYINARVINNSVRNRNNYITLNKGRMQGIKPDMGVITPLGVIGIVRNVSANFSSVISFLHADIQISAKLKKDNQLGTLLWEGYNYRNATMLYVPPHVELSVGDTIITSGYSQIFPEGLLLGTIKAFEVKRGDNFYTINIELFTDFNNLNYVSVVRSIYGDELKELEKTNTRQ